MRRLRAVVLGAGWAGEGHALAMREAGVEVVAICARRAERAQALAARLGVARGDADWRAVLRAERPDIVCLGTPATLRLEAMEEALALGCHLFCDKPLALDADAARRAWDEVRRAGVRHAYASTYRYDPSVAWLAELVAGGAVGRLDAVEVTQRHPAPGVQPWSWMLDAAEGGGWLHNGFPHLLGALERLVGGEVRRVVGDAVLVARRVPVLPEVGDSRQTGTAALPAEGAASLPWREATAETACRALLDLHGPAGTVRASVAWCLGTPVAWPANGLRLFGEQGTLVAEDRGHGAYAVFRREGARVEPLPVPERLREAVPSGPDRDALVQARWTALARDFVADVQGRPHAPYLTFRDGWRYQAAADAVRSGRGWTIIPPD